ncbi:MAG: LysR substrate-binding domain-containing protein [Leucobacter sp.]
MNPEDSASPSTDTEAQDQLTPGSQPTPLRLGFARGIAPNKWAKRWAAARPLQPLELVPVAVLFGGEPDQRTRGSRAESSHSDLAAAPVDVMLERARPGARPTADHSLLLYRETIALVVAVDHELAETSTGRRAPAIKFDVADIELVHLLDHPEHASEWPKPEPWADPAHAPSTVGAALELVSSGLGAILLPLPLARHLTDKRRHAILVLTGDELPQSTVWASWSADRDDDDVQQLAGVLRGRTARSSRATHDAAANRTAPRNTAPSGHSEQDAHPPKPQKKKPKLNPNSRGAQLAAAKEKAASKGSGKGSGRGSHSSPGKKSHGSRRSKKRSG